jgi:hypothetical protein
MLNDFASDFRLVLCCAKNLFVVRADGKDVVKRHFATDFSFELLDLNRLARRDAVLLSPTSDYGVHAAS